MDEEIMLPILAAFVAEHERLPPPEAEHDGVRIGHWCALVREGREAGELAPELEAQLEAQPLWRWEIDTWEMRFALMREYVAEHGGPPPVDAVYQNYALGEWCSTQRRVNACSLAGGRTERLEAVPGWEW